MSGLEFNFQQLVPAQTSIFSFEVGRYEHTYLVN